MTLLQTLVKYPSLKLAIDRNFFFLEPGVTRLVRILFANSSLLLLFPAAVASAVLSEGIYDALPTFIYFS